MERAVQSPVMPSRPVHLDVDDSQVTGEKIDAASFLSGNPRVVNLDDERAKRAAAQAQNKEAEEAEEAEEIVEAELVENSRDVKGSASSETSQTTKASPPAPTKGSGLLDKSQLGTNLLDGIAAMVATAFPKRVHGQELDVEIGDEVLCIAGTGREASKKKQIDYLVCRVVNMSYGDDPELEVVERIDTRGGHHADAPGCWLDVGQRFSTFQKFIVHVIKPEGAASEGEPSVLVAKSRRKRYRVEPGELIELLADEARPIPEGATWKPSRDDVELQVVEKDGERALVALAGPEGKVNVALLAANEGGKSRPVCSWKFELVRLA